MTRALVLVLLPLVAALWLDPAHACTCDITNSIVHPPGGTIPAQDGWVGYMRAIRTPTITVTYVDDPAQAPIPGTFRTYGGEYDRVWTFVPQAPLTVGRTVRAAVGGAELAERRTGEFVVSSSTIASPPTFAGITGMRAFATHYKSRPPTSCAEPVEQDRVELEDFTPPGASAPLYRYFFYRQGTPPPAEPSFYGVPNYYLSSVSCGARRYRCADELPVNLQPGETWCARVEATDLMGHRSGYDAEVCATVVGEEVDVTALGALLVCMPAASPDAGVAADVGPAPSVDAGTPADASAAVSPAPGNDAGCTCLRPQGGGPAGLASVLLLGWTLLRRRRPR